MFLFICTLGRSRSRTAEVLSTLGGANARCCGTSKHALIAINNQLISEASKIICMGPEHEEFVKNMANYHGQPIITLGIGDIYSPFQDTLIDRLLATTKSRDFTLHNILISGRERYLEDHPLGFYSNLPVDGADTRLSFKYQQH